MKARHFSIISSSVTSPLHEACKETDKPFKCDLTVLAVAANWNFSLTLVSGGHHTMNTILVLVPSLGPLPEDGISKLK